MTTSAFSDISTLSAALEQRAVSSVELVDQAITRIEALDDQINAVVVRDFERARQTAHVADGNSNDGQRIIQRDRVAHDLGLS